jgi:hypothetical protein
MTTPRWNAYMLLGISTPQTDMVVDGYNDMATLSRALKAKVGALGEADVNRIACVLLSGFRVRSMYIHWLLTGRTWVVDDRRCRVSTDAITCVDDFIASASNVLFGRLYAYVGIASPEHATSLDTVHINSMVDAVRMQAYSSVFDSHDRRVFDHRAVPTLSHPSAKQFYDDTIRNGGYVLARLDRARPSMVVRLLASDDMFPAPCGSDTVPPPCVEDVVKCF